MKCWKLSPNPQASISDFVTCSTKSAHRTAEVEANTSDKINPSTYVIKTFRLNQVEVSETFEQ